MLNNGFKPSPRGRHITNTSSEECKWLKLILEALENNATLSYGILNALGGSIEFNTTTQYDLLSAATHTFAANTIHSISFSVIKGSVVVSTDGGSTSVTYPVGANVNLEASKTINNSIIFTVSGVALDGNNEVLIQTIS